MREAALEAGVPVTAGWFLVNVRDAPWLHNRMRSVCRFGGEGDAHFDDLGVSLYWLQPGQPMSLYHHEAGQEDFLVLSGAGILLIEGQERLLRPWDFVHCPPRAAHTIVAGDEPALILAVGARKEKGSARYPAEPVAIAHGAGVPDEATTATDVYASFGEPARGPAPELFGRGDGEPLNAAG
ncbi:MAG: cupin domain-containing protein [Solirubrobacteraceae bacterium]